MPFKSPVFPLSYDKNRGIPLIREHIVRIKRLMSGSVSLTWYKQVSLCSAPPDGLRSDLRYVIDRSGYMGNYCLLRQFSDITNKIYMKIVS
jgi:hypothetical protein